MMANIQPNAQGKVQRARKQLKQNLQQLKDADSLTAGQRDALFAKVQIALVRIQLWELNQLSDVD